MTIQNMEPVYFSDFRKYIDQKFKETNANIETSIETSIEGLAISVSRQFSEYERNLKEYMDEKFATKLDLYEMEVRVGDKFDVLDERLEKIEGHIGRYEIRAQNLEVIVLRDHKPRIEALEAVITG